MKLKLKALGLLNIRLNGTKIGNNKNVIVNLKMVFWKVQTNINFKIKMSGSPIGKKYIASITNKIF